MPNDYILRPDARFHAWQNNFVTYINGHLADLGLAAPGRLKNLPTILTPTRMLRCPGFPLDSAVSLSYDVMLGKR